MWERRKINEFHAFSEKSVLCIGVQSSVVWLLLHRMRPSMYNCISVEHYIPNSLNLELVFFMTFQNIFSLLVRSHTTFFDVISLKNGNANLINGCPETWKFMKWWLDGSASASVLSFHPPWHAGWWMADGAHCILILRNMDTCGWCCKYLSFSSGRLVHFEFLDLLHTKNRPRMVIKPLRILHN